MSQDSNDFHLPPRVEKDDGTPRMVGFELEFSGISLDQTAEVVQSTLGGQLASETSAERVIHTDSLGEFIIELDWDYLKSKASGTDRGEEGSEWLEPLSQAAAVLVPVEIVCPPIPLTNLSALTPMVLWTTRGGCDRHGGVADRRLRRAHQHGDPTPRCRDAVFLSARLRPPAVVVGRCA